MVGTRQADALQENIMLRGTRLLLGPEATRLNDLASRLRSRLHRV
jgi:hypothetical protein